MVLFKFIVLLVCGFLINANVLAQNKVVSITQFGAEKNTHANVLPAVKEALQYCKEHPGTILDFPKGRYDFWPSVCDKQLSEVVFPLKHIHELTVHGNDSQFILHGWMGIARVDSCSDITFKNFSVDWDRPWISQGQIVESTSDYLDVRIDRRKYPYIVEKQRIVFLGEGIKMPVLNDVYNNLYDKDTKEIMYQTWDSPLGNFFDNPTEELKNGIVRFHVQTKLHPKPGTYVTFYHAHYGISGFVFENSKDVMLKDLQIYHTLGHGVLGVHTENITMKNASLMVNEAKDRVFSSVADASHFSSCKGLIKIENCAHTGQGDDFINVHGRSILISRIVNNKTIEIKNKREKILKGDEVWFINRETAQRGEVRIVSKFEPFKENNKKTDRFLVTFTKPIPTTLKAGDFIENKTWTPSFIMRNCKVLKRNRARGILFTTPKKVIIEHNYFRTAGTAILIEGDMDFWLESGANTNVQIRNNIFEDCLTSGNAHGKRNEWGEAIITISPSHRPLNSLTKPYHKNICITDNVFKVFDAPLVRARSVENLQFTNNQIIKTYSYQPYTWQRAAFLLDGCRKVIIKQNHFDKKYTTRDILIEHMKRSDVSITYKEAYHIDLVKGLNTYQTW